MILSENFFLIDEISLERCWKFENKNDLLNYAKKLEDKTVIYCERELEINMVFLKYNLLYIFFKNIKFKIF